MKKAKYRRFCSRNRVGTIFNISRNYLGEVGWKMKRYEEFLMLR